MNAENDGLILLLKEISDSLQRNGHPGQAAYVAALATAAEWDDTAVGPGLASGAMWGGAGSVFDVSEFNSPDERRHCAELLVKLAEEMRQRGIASIGAESASKVLLSWLRSGIL